MAETQTNKAADDNSFAVMSGAPLWIAGMFLALANFMVVLDTTIANVSVPNIAGGLAVSPSQGTWVITSYAVAEAITVPLTGWLAQRFGAVRVFVIAMFGFGICSALCGLAHSLPMLIVFRILQGLSGWSMTTVVGPIAGPLLGGALVDTVGWPWVFYINVPVAILCSIFAWRLLASRETVTKQERVDYIGLSLLIVWISAMQIMLDKGKDLDWFQSPFIVGLAIIAGIGFASFIIWELTDDHPIVDLKIFRHRGFAAATLIMCLAFGAFFSTVVLIPLWLQTSMNYNATWAGRAMAFQGVLAVVMSPIVARLTTKVDSRILVSFGVGVMGLVSLWRTGFASNIDFWSVSLPQLAQGFAMPFFFIPLMGLAMGSVLPRETASAAGLINFMRTTAGAFGTSITTTAWENIATTHRTDLVGILNKPQATMDSLTAAGMSAGQALGTVDTQVQSQAVMLATDHVFLITTLVFFVGASVAWIAPKPKPMAQAPSGH